MHTHQNIWKYVRKQEGHFRFKVVGAVLGLLVLCTALSVSVEHAHAAVNACASSYSVRSGDTLSGIAARFGHNWSALAASNGIGNPNHITVGQQLCVANNGGTGVTAAPLAPAQPGASIASMINQVFGPYAPGAMRVAMCESSLNPNAINSQPVGYSHAQGLFQILYPATWNTTSQRGNSPYNAWANINAAHEIFVRDGHSWREWVCQP